MNTVICGKMLIAKATTYKDHWLFLPSLPYFEGEIYTWLKFLLDQQTAEVEELKQTP